MRLPRSIGRALLALACASAGACDTNVPPEPDLGGLLHTPPEPRPGDVERATNDVAEIERAATFPHHLLAKAIGAHKAHARFETAVSSAGKPVDAVSSTLDLVYDARARYSARLYNDKDYGRDVIFDGSALYLRPRFGKYHKRPPESTSEPTDILDEMLSAPAAQLQLFAPGIAIKRSHDELVGGRAAVVIDLEKASSPRARPTEATSQRKWRESATTEAVSGSVALDKETGVLLSAKVEGTISYTRDGQNFEMTLSLDHELSDIGTAETVTAPEDSDTVTAPRVLSELAERESLLRGIAPPARRGKSPQNPDGRANPTTQQ